MDIVTRSADTGVTIQEIIDQAATVGVDLDKQSVSTLVSSLKRSGSFILSDGLYSIAPEGTQPEPPVPLGRRRKE